MPDLIAQGREPQQRWRRSLPEGQPVVLGRMGCAWTVPWDQQVSRQHARLEWSGDTLEVTRLPGTRNPIFVLGKVVDSCRIQAGQHFVIGQTTFTLADQQAHVTDAPQPVQQQSFTAQYLREVQFRHPDYRIEVLSRLPEVISGAAGDAELFVRLVSMLLAGVPRADAAAVVAVDGCHQEDACGAGVPPAGEDAGETPTPQQNAGEMPTPHEDAGETPAPQCRVGVRVLHWDQRLMIASDFQPSQGLIVEALRHRQSVLHVWRGPEAAAPTPAYTISETFDWAFCTPVPGNACAGWGLYVAGRFGIEQAAEKGTGPICRHGPEAGTDAQRWSHKLDLSPFPPSDPMDLREDVKFTELVAAMLGSLRQMRLLEHQQAALSQFFSPLVLQTLAVEDPELVLAPRETTVTVMFCDLRGFSRESERHGSDLLGLLQRVSKALGVMTHHIRQQGGVVGDFHGDAAMGFWGWPLPQGDAVARTCRAALAIRSEFEAAPDLQAGIGIATGRAVAGKIGTVDQVKVTVFGPVVNLASRLEGMTKSLHAPVLLDETTALAIREEVPREVARVRRLAVVRPYGLRTTLEVSELLPPAAEYPELTDEHLGYYEAALDAFLAGRWRESFQLLHRIPAEDRAKDFLTVYIAQQNRTPPTNWDGVIPLPNK